MALDLGGCGCQSETRQEWISWMLPYENIGPGYRGVMTMRFSRYIRRGETVIDFSRGSVGRVSMDLGDGIVVSCTVLDVVQNGMLQLLRLVSGNLAEQAGERGNTDRAEPAGHVEGRNGVVEGRAVAR